MNDALKRANAARRIAAEAYAALEAMGIPGTPDGLLAALNEPPGTPKAELARTLVASLESLYRALKMTQQFRPLA